MKLLSFCKCFSLICLTSERKLIYDKASSLLTSPNKVYAPIYYAHIRH